MINKYLLHKGITVFTALALAIGLGIGGAMAMQKDSGNSGVEVVSSKASGMTKDDATKRKPVEGFLCPPFCW